MRARRTYLALGVATAVVAAIAVPAIGASSHSPRVVSKRPVSLSARGGIGSFTPAAADPRVAAIYGRAGLANSGFRFTPASTNPAGSHAVTVAVRAVSTAGKPEPTRASTASVSITPVAYNLGMAIGWKRFAIAGDVARVDMGALPGSREKLDVGISYNAPKWSGRLQVGQDRPVDVASANLTGGRSVNFDLGGSYSLTKNLDVTAGVRYKTERRDRLQIIDDGRRDSQAVYIGTAFKF
ncbi:hypothetical protein [Sphingomonas sp.]|uniref:hypothetical protein n=1 Tax=Sphingomonas sp. TaxID=28214 RepID=UPI002DB88598|nr:hypothetical protein [Sphingomonas sp.]HEU4968403.1 hypothetical protein [Sphingomonas sp.]